MSHNCPACGRSAAPTDRFCPACGKPLAAAPVSAAPASNVSARTGMRDALVVIGVIAIVSVLFFAFRSAPEKPQPPQATVSENPAHMGDVPMGMIDNLPQDYNSLVQSGNEFMDQENYAVAAEVYRRALAIDGNSADVRTDYGACLHSMGLPERAIEEFQRVLKDHPEHSIAHYNLGIVYFTLNQPDSARVYWNNYLRLDPNGVAAANARQFLDAL
jgi:tetratricopeptide (TPR) repeat protein